MCLKMTTTDRKAGRVDDGNAFQSTRLRCSFVVSTLSSLPMARAGRDLTGELDVGTSIPSPG